MSESIVIVGAARTPMGAFQGDFSSLAAHDLGGAAIKAAIERAGIDPAVVGEVLFGNCLMAGQGQAPARQAAYKGGLPDSAGAVTLSKMCGSAMKAAMLSYDMLMAGTHDVMVDAWSRGQKVRIHGWSFGVHDGLLQDLQMSVDGSKPLDAVYKAAVQRIRYKWSKPGESTTIVPRPRTESSVDALPSDGIASRPAPAP